MHGYCNYVGTYNCIGIANWLRYKEGTYGGFCGLTGDSVTLCHACSKPLLPGTARYNSVLPGTTECDDLQKPPESSAISSDLQIFMVNVRRYFNTLSICTLRSESPHAVYKGSMKKKKASDATGIALPYFSAF
eukprot:1324642-Amorphochlora_amoeboformis.AAC.1